MAGKVTSKRNTRDKCEREVAYKGKKRQNMTGKVTYKRNRDKREYAKRPTQETETHLAGKVTSKRNRDKCEREVAYKGKKETKHDWGK